MIEKDSADLTYACSITRNAMVPVKPSENHRNGDPSVESDAEEQYEETITLLLSRRQHPCHHHALTQRRPAEAG